MVSPLTKVVVERAKALYCHRLQGELEATHHGRHVAIEPESGQHFIADSYGDAVAEARSAHPDRITFVIRIGYPAAIHMGRLTA